MNPVLLTHPSRSGNAAARTGSPRWWSLTEVRAGAAKSVSVSTDRVGGEVHQCRSAVVAPSSTRSGSRIHFWLLDRWHIPPGRSVLAEVYPALWNRGFAREGRDAHQHDAYSISAWMRHADDTGSLSGFFDPDLEEDERKTAEIEGWILGVA
jgi:hypothetical protein